MESEFVAVSELISQIHWFVHLVSLSFSHSFRFGKCYFWRDYLNKRSFVQFVCGVGEGDQFHRFFSEAKRLKFNIYFCYLNRIVWSNDGQVYGHCDHQFLIYLQGILFRIRFEKGFYTKKFHLHSACVHEM